MTPIVMDRKTHEIISAPDLTQEQRNLLWEHIVRAYLDAHPEVLKADIPENSMKSEDT